MDVDAATGVEIPGMPVVGEDSEDVESTCPAGEDAVAEGAAENVGIGGEELGDGTLAVVSEMEKASELVPGTGGVAEDAVLGMGLVEEAGICELSTTTRALEDRLPGEREFELGVAEGCGAVVLLSTFTTVVAAAETDDPSVGSAAELDLGAGLEDDGEGLSDVDSG